MCLLRLLSMCNCVNICNDIFYLKDITLQRYFFINNLRETSFSNGLLNVKHINNNGLLNTLTNGV